MKNKRNEANYSWKYNLIQLCVRTLKFNILKIDGFNLTYIPLLSKVIITIYA